IHEQTLTFAPRIIAIFLTLLFIGGWMFEKLIEYAREMIEKFMGMV
ncbi:MAG: flagellar biosynthetic protein FliQ, partial [Thermotogae bacterium]